LEESDVIDAERKLFDSVYKGVTDVVTKWVWPSPAFWATRLLASCGVSPNVVTSIGIVCMFLAAYLFAVGSIEAGLVAAWLMTFLDTVDGKLARVAVRSSRLGDKLDHWTDVVHPPVWWACLAIGISSREHEAVFVLEATALVLACYVVGRFAEVTFKICLGFNQFIWRPFDATFRLVIARRNTILLLLTLGAATGRLYEAWLVAAAWSLVSAAVQCVRLLQGALHSPITSYLCTKDDILLISLSPKARAARNLGEQGFQGANRQIPVA
jgi:phosphatidylglycerophosphate synthase